MTAPVPAPWQTVGDEMTRTARIGTWEVTQPARLSDDGVGLEPLEFYAGDDPGAEGDFRIVGLANARAFAAALLEVCDAAERVFPESVS